MRPFNLPRPVHFRLAARVDALVASLSEPLSPLEIEFVELVSWKVSKYHRKDYYRFFSVAWALSFLGKLPPNHPSITSADKQYLQSVHRLFDLDVSGDYRAFLAAVFSTDHDLFLFSAIFKYVLLSREKQFHRFVTDWCAYKRTIGYAHLVILNLLNLPKIEGIFQDIYFKEFYPEQYAEMVHRTRNLAGGMRSHFFTINVVNELSEMMTEARAWGATHVRFKSYFSIYNKIVRKGLEHVLDVIGIRIVFPTMQDLTRFSRLFEHRIYITQKKNYIAQPKPNGYQSLHYKFFYNHLQVSSYVELQLRTRTMDERIASKETLSGLAYALREKKYHPTFREIHLGLAEMARLLGAVPVVEPAET